MNPSPESVQYADYILNHYSKDSYSDKICLARSLEQNGWKNISAVKSDTPRTDALLDNQEFDNVDFDTSCQQLAELCRELERELNEAMLNVRECELEIKDLTIRAMQAEKSLTSLNNPVQ